MKEHKHLGVYGLLIKDGKILLIKKCTGPYDGKLDLPGGTMKFGERPFETLRREFLEETGIEILDFSLFDTDSVFVDWNSDNGLFKVHHTGIFYKILDYKNEIKKELEVDSINDDSLGAEFYDIDSLSKNNLSSIAILELEKLGYVLK